MSASGEAASLTLRAPAKLNLFLHVVGRRDDGYHLLETVFHFLDLTDEITLERTSAPGIVRGRGAPGVAEEDDLVVRAARALAEAPEVATALPRGLPWGVRITVRKQLPMGGGLGGGSSDAAAVLLGLNRLWELNLPRETLMRLGLALGADVPVFLGGEAAFAAGVGERLRPVRVAPSCYLVAVPAVAVSTVAVFNDPALTRDSLPLTIGGFPWEMETQQGLSQLLARTRNDCEAVVRARHPEVAQALDWLSRFGPARMTGTGACSFVRFEDEAQASRALSQAPDGLRVLLARGLNRSPVLDALPAG